MACHGRSLGSTIAQSITKSHFYSRTLIEYGDSLNTAAISIGFLEPETLTKVHFPGQYESLYSSLRTKLF